MSVYTFKKKKKPKESEQLVLKASRESKPEVALKAKTHGDLEFGAALETLKLDGIE